MNTDEIIREAQERTERWRENVRPAAEYFHEKEGKLEERKEAINNLSDHLSLDRKVSAQTLSALVEDVVDPVVQLRANGGKYVGVIEYEELDGAYGYVDFHDVIGKRRRVVCAQCVKNESHDSNVSNATAGAGSFSNNPDASYEELLDEVHSHYETSHDVVPHNVETGATLATGTTIGGNISFHAGNDGTGSGLDADLLRGNNPSFYNRPPVIYGDGADGTVNITSNTTQSKVVRATDYTLNAGNTVSASQPVIILATNSITIDGTINVDKIGTRGRGFVHRSTGTGGNGGSSGDTTSEVSNGGDGGPGAGGGGGGMLDSSGNGGGNGQDAEQFIATSGEKSVFEFNFDQKYWHQIMELSDSMVSGGGNGGYGDQNGPDSGGAGGPSGGTVVLISPDVTVSGTISAIGGAGNDGEDGGGFGGAGGGGGGTGGFVGLVSTNLTENSPTYNLSGGAGGLGGSSEDDDGDGGDGGAGENGVVYRLGL